MVNLCTRAASLWAVVIIAGASYTVAQGPADPNTAADGIYTECFMGMSWACLQRKSLLFIDRMGKSERFPLIADGVISLVRTGPPNPEVTEESLRALNSDSLGELMDTTIYDFFQSHVFRFELPSWLKGSSDEQQRSDNAVDFYVGDNIEEGRKKGGLGGGGGGGGGKKGMKKMMMMMCMMAASKFMMVVPLLMGLTKLMAVKALIMGFISLTISKIMILKKLKSQQGGSSGWSSGGSGGSGWSSGGGGGGGGGGWQSGGSSSGGWDRSFSAHNLAYQGQMDNSA